MQKLQFVSHHPDCRNLWQYLADFVSSTNFLNSTNRSLSDDHFSMLQEQNDDQNYKITSLENLMKIKDEKIFALETKVQEIKAISE